MPLGPPDLYSGRRPGRNSVDVYATAILWTTFPTTFFLEFMMGMAVEAAYVGRVQIWDAPLLLLAALVLVVTFSHAFRLLKSLIG